MPRTKGALGKHKKEKVHKEKKKRGRPSKQKQHQQQHQTVNVNVNSDGSSGHKPQNMQPVQLPLNMFDSSLINPSYGLNIRQPINPPTNANPDMITPFLQAMIANQKQNQQPVTITQPKQPEKQPVIITQPKQPEKQPVIITQPKQPGEKPIIILPPKADKPHFSHEDVQHLIDEIHHKQEQETPAPIPQNTPKPLEKPVMSDILGLTINDKYDGLKLKNKTMPWSDVASGAAYGIAGGVAGGIAGGSLINNAILSAGSYIGYKVGGEAGAAIGGILSSSVADKMNPSYKPSTKNTESHTSGYEDIPSYSQQRVNGGTVVETRNIRQRAPPRAEPKQSKTIISRLGDALKDVAPSTRTPVKQKIKESKLLLDLEKRQTKYGTIQPTINETDVTPQEPKTSTITQIKEGAKDLYRRLSGSKKGQYTQLSTTDDDVDFKTTLQKSKTEGQKQGTYAILHQDDPELDHETEMEALNTRRRSRIIRPRDEVVNLMDQITNTPNPPWQAMKEFGQQNEKNIRKSITRTNQAEREQRIKDGLATPTRPPKQTNQPTTPRQHFIVNKFANIISKSQEKQKENKFIAILHEAEPLIMKRELSRAKKVVGRSIADLDQKLIVLNKRKAKLQPDIEKHDATTIQSAIRGKVARNAMKKARDTEATFKGVEDQMTSVEKKLSYLHSNINEQRPKGLRSAIKKLQDRRSELVHRTPTMDRVQKVEELRKINQTENHYINVIAKRKPGPVAKK